MALNKILERFSEPGHPIAMGEVRAISENEGRNICKYKPSIPQKSMKKSGETHDIIENRDIEDFDDYDDYEYEYEDLILSTGRRKRFAGSREERSYLDEGPYLDNPWRTEILDKDGKLICHGIVVATTLVLVKRVKIGK